MPAPEFDPFYVWLGIPPAAQPADHYRLLGLSAFESDPLVIRNAADRQMQYVKSKELGEYSKESQQILNQLAGARRTLLNSDLKAAYDAQLREQYPEAATASVPANTISVPLWFRPGPHWLWPAVATAALLLSLINWWLGSGPAASAHSSAGEQDFSGNTKDTGNAAAEANPWDFAGIEAGQLRDDNLLGMKFRWCPPGEFLMGSPPDEVDRSQDEAQVQVTLSHGFWMAQHEVTQGDWELIMGTTLQQQQAKVDGNPVLVGEGPRFPMYLIDAGEMYLFCERFTRRERLAGRLPAGQTYTLPTEAQWEYACRAGTTTAMAFGDDLRSTQANFDGSQPYNQAAAEDYPSAVVTVGRYQANAWGLHDMHGNVREHCSDFYTGQLPGGTDPFNTNMGSHLEAVTRGGDWEAAGKYCRSAFRYNMDYNIRENRVGFRLIRIDHTPPALPGIVE